MYIVRRAVIYYICAGSSAGAEIQDLTIIIVSCMYSCYVHIFSEVVYHFPSTGTWKSDVAKYMRGDRYMKFYEHRASYIFSVLTFPRACREKVQS